jgi:hypothetical protein
MGVELGKTAISAAGEEGAANCSVTRVHAANEQPSRRKTRDFTEVVFKQPAASFAEKG